MDRTQVWSLEAVRCVLVAQAAQVLCQPVISSCHAECRHCCFSRLFWKTFSGVFPLHMFDLNLHVFYWISFTFCACITVASLLYIVLLEYACILLFEFFCLSFARIAWMCRFSPRHNLQPNLHSACVNPLHRRNPLHSLT